MNKSSLGLLFALILLSCLRSLGQHPNLLVHFNNLADERKLKADFESYINMDKFLSIAEQTQNEDTEIQVVFLDPTKIARFTLTNLHSTSPDIYVTKWKAVHGTNKKRILFLFCKETDIYKFKNLEVTHVVRSTQLPEVVRSFISNQIISPQPSVELALKEGINALGNAYDQQFKSRLIEHSPKLLQDQKYYKGYSCIEFNYYYFERVNASQQLATGCSDLYYLYQFKYFPIVPIIPPNQSTNLNNQSKLFDYLNLKALAYKTTNPINGLSVDQKIEESDYGNIYYSFDGKFLNVMDEKSTYKYLNFNYPETTYTGFTDNLITGRMREQLNEIYWNPKMFKEWKYDREQNSPLIFESNLEACSAKYYIKVLNGRIRPTFDQVDEMSGLSTYGLSDFNHAQPTWCNVFARELSNKVFGTDAFPPYSCYELTQSTFRDKTQYIELTGESNSKEAIWSLINKGFTVYFASSSHIETGFPDDVEFTHFRYRHQNDRRYDPGNYNSKYDDNSLHEYETSQYLVVGAGSSVGFKATYDNYSWLSTTAKAYLFVGYLSKKY